MMVSNRSHLPKGGFWDPLATCWMIGARQIVPDLTRRLMRMSYRMNICSGQEQRLTCGLVQLSEATVQIFVAHVSAVLPLYKGVYYILDAAISEHLQALGFAVDLL